LITFFFFTYCSDSLHNAPYLHYSTNDHLDVSCCLDGDEIENPDRCSDTRGINCGWLFRPHKLMLCDCIKSFDKMTVQEDIHGLELQSAFDKVKWITIKERKNIQPFKNSFRSHYD